MYALVLAVSKDVKYIWRQDAKKIKDKRTYAVQYAKVMAVMAIVPAAGGVASLIWNIEESRLPVILAIAISLIMCICIGIQLLKNVK